MVGGPQGDTGLTGRKIIVDTYGGMGRHGGGAFSGKDPSKVDRSAAYMGRYVAKNIVAAGLAPSAEIQFAYAIGYPDPVSVCVNTFGTGRGERRGNRTRGLRGVQFQAGGHHQATESAAARFIPRPPITATSAKNDPDITWERTDKAEALRKAAGKSAGSFAGDLKKAARLVERPPGQALPRAR